MTHARRPACSWPASLLPTLLLAGLLGGGLATTGSSGPEPVVEMTVTTAR